MRPWKGMQKVPYPWSQELPTSHFLAELVHPLLQTKFKFLFLLVRKWEPLKRSITKEKHGQNEMGAKITADRCNLQIPVLWYCHKQSKATKRAITNQATQKYGEVAISPLDRAH